MTPHRPWRPSRWRGRSTAYISSGTWSLVGLEVVRAARQRAHRWPPTSPTRAATRAPSRCSATSWACGSSSRAGARCGRATARHPTRRSAAWRRPLRMPRRSSTPTTGASCGQATCPPASGSTAPRRGSRCRPRPRRCCGSSSRASRCATRGSSTCWPTSRVVPSTRSTSSAAARRTGCSASWLRTPAAARSWPDRSRRRPSATSPSRPSRPASCSRHRRGSRARGPLLPDGDVRAAGRLVRGARPLRRGRVAGPGVDSVRQRVRRGGEGASR